MTALPPTPAPGVNKAVGAVLAGAASTILVFVLDTYLLHPPLPAEIGQAIQTLLTTLVVYYVPHGGDA